MRSGSLTRQYKDPPPPPTGPYYQLGYTLDMKSRTDYIRKDCVSEVRRQITRYKRHKQLNAEWVSLGIELSKPAMKLKRLGS